MSGLVGVKLLERIAAGRLRSGASGLRVVLCSVALGGLLIAWLGVVACESTVVVMVRTRRSAGGAVAGNRSGLGRLDDRCDGDGAVSLGGSLLAAKVSKATVDSFGDGEHAGGLLGVDDLRVVHDLGGDVALVAGAGTRAGCNGIHACRCEGRFDGTLGGLRSNACGLGAGAVCCERSDDLGGDMADGAVGDAGRAGSDRVDLAGCDGGSDGCRGSRGSRENISVARSASRGCIRLGGCESSVGVTSSREGKGSIGGRLSRRNRLGDRLRSSLGGSRSSRRGGRVRAALTNQVRHGIGTSTDSDEVSTAVLVVSKPDIPVIPIVHDVGSAEESVAENGELIVLEDAENAAVVVVPDKVCVGDLDDGVAELEVDGALEVGDGAVDVDVGAGGSLGGGEGCDDLVEDGAGEGADGVSAVEEDGLAVCLGEDRVFGAVVLDDADAVEVDPVTTIVRRALVSIERGGTYRVRPSGEDSAGMMGRFSRRPVYFLVSRPPKMTAPRSLSRVRMSRLNARLLMRPCLTMLSITRGYGASQPFRSGAAPMIPTLVKELSYATPKTWLRIFAAKSRQHKNPPCLSEEC